MSIGIFIGPALIAALISLCLEDPVKKPVCSHAYEDCEEIVIDEEPQIPKVDP